MSRRRVPLAITMLGLLAAACLVAGTTPAAAAPSERGEKWQFYLPMTYSSSENFTGQGGSTVDLSSDFGWGFAFGYNLNERVLLGFEITWLSANYDARTQTDATPPDGIPDGTFTVGGTLDSSTLQFMGQFNFMETRVTPFVRAGLGSTYVDTNIPSGPAQGTCWWHPWYGYICGAWQPTFDESAFSYGAGIGVRGDVTDTFYLELSYNELWIELDSVSGTPSVNGGRLNIGWIF